MEIEQRSRHTSTATAAHEFSLRRHALTKLNRRPLLLCSAIAFVSYVNRSSLTYAANDLCSDLELTHTEYGLGVSLFYLGYAASQGAVCVLLKYLSPPVWFSSLIFTWGCCAVSLGFVQNSVQLYAIRVLLGVAQGGVLPGILYYLTLFYPDAYLTEPYSLVMAATTISMPISSPMAAGLLSLDGLLNLEGWRVLFFVEGLIPLGFSVVIFLYLPASIESSSFLSPEEKIWLMTAGDSTQKDISSMPVLSQIYEIVLNGSFWAVTVATGFHYGIFSVLMYWVTLIIQEMLHGSEETERSSNTCGTTEGDRILSVGLAAIPFILAGVFCIVTSKYSSKIKNRTRFAATMQLLCAALSASWVATRNFPFVFGFSSLMLAIGVSNVPMGVAFGFVATLFPQQLRSTCLSLSNSIADLGGFVFPVIAGLLVDGHGYGYAIAFGACMMTIASFLTFLVNDSLVDPHLVENQVSTALDPKSATREYL